MISILAAALSMQAAPQAAEEVARWQASGREQIEARARDTGEIKPAKNVIVFLADGVGPTFHTAARIHAKQVRQSDGRDGQLSFEGFPHAAFTRTSAVDDYVTDSAASATALLSGIKTVNGGVGVPAGYRPDDCSRPAANPPTLGELAAASGRATGIVTTSYLVDASPAAFYAHTPVRGWVVDDRVPEAHRQAGCRGVVEQLFDSSIDVALGGGRIVFAGKDWRDPESGDPGLRADDRAPPVLELGRRQERD